MQQRTLNLSLSRRLATAVIGATALLGSGLAAAETTLERVQKQGFIRVGFANEAPYAFATPDGKLNGESPAVFRHVMKQLGVNEVDGVLTEWGALIPGLKAGRFDAIVASMYITPKRCEQILFANPTYGIGEAFVVKKGNPDGIKTYDDAAKKDLKIAFVAGTAEIEHARLAGMKRSQEVTVPNFAAAVATVKAGRASAAAFTSLTAKDLASKDEAIERAEPFTFDPQRQEVQRRRLLRIPHGRHQPARCRQRRAGQVPGHARAPEDGR